jgi:CRISPR-associated protein Csd1
MILQALQQLCQNEKLNENPDYEFRRISWQIDISVSGKLLGIHSFRTDLNANNDRKEKYVGRWSSVPKQPTRTSGAKAFFLVDKAEYILGLDPAGKRSAADRKERQGLFQAQVQALYDETSCEQANSILKFLADLKTQQKTIKDSPAFAEMEPNDLLGFAVKGEWVQLDETVKRYWSVLRSKEAEASDREDVLFQCLITGDSVDEIPLFPLVKKVPGGTSSGVAIVSHNSKAFLSHGLDGSENAPVSRTAAEACGVALARLLDVTFPNPKNIDEALPRRMIKLSANTAVCFWAKESNKESNGLLNAIPNVLSGNRENEDKVTSTYQSLWHGQPVPLKKPNDFYALTLSGTQGRAIVRDWLETSLQDVNNNLAQHFSDFNICRNTNPKKGTEPPPTVPMYWLFKSLTAEGRSETIPPAVETGFVRSALRGIPYPFQMLQRALVRTRAEAGGDEWNDSMRRDARAAVIKAVLNRKRRQLLKSNPERVNYPEVDVEMNPVLENPGYSLGMLTAVLERLQALALGDVNASVVDRYFSAASANPRSVFVRLLKNSQHHFRKARDSDEKFVSGSARYMERLKDQILSQFNVEAPADQSEQNKRSVYPGNSGIPMHLSLEDQGLFVLGYHQMRHWFFLNKEDRAAWEKEYPTAPSIFHRKKQDETEKESEPTED